MQSNLIVYDILISIYMKTMFESNERTVIMNEDNLSEEVAFLTSTDDLLLRTRREDPLPFDLNTFKPFLLFGQRIPKLHRVGLYLHLLIVALQYFFFINTQVLLNIVLETNIVKVSKNDFTVPLLSSAPYLIIPFIVFLCDRQLISRYRLVLSSLIMAFLASCILLILFLFEHFEEGKLDILAHDEHNNNNSLNLVLGFVYVIKYLSCGVFLVLFSISYSLSFSFSIAFGLDLLHGTHAETLFLYFPLFYISKNVGALFAYLVYARIEKDDPYTHCIIATIVITLAILLSICGRCCGYFKDSAIVTNNFSFKRGLGILFATLKLKIFKRNMASFKKLMLYTARKRGYEEPNCLVDRTLAMIKINITLSILIPLLGSYQVLYQLFPDQAVFLNFLAKPVTHRENSEYYCDSESYFLSYWFINPLTILLFAPLIEYLFNDIVFEVWRCDMPCWVRCISFRIKFIRTNCAYPFRKRLHKYVASVDPILKRIFWGLPFGLLSALCALFVEVIRIQFPVQLKCGDGDYYFSSLIPLVAQIPQYFYSGLLEAISAIGLLQYVYYLCSYHFKNSLKGFFFSLFYFYYGVAGIISNLFNFSLVQICANHCNSTFTSDTDISYSSNGANNWCLLINTDCANSNMPNAWAIWVIVILVYLVMIPLFYIFSHWNHWSVIRRERNERDMGGETF